MKKTILFVAGLLTLAFIATACIGGVDKTQEDFDPSTLQENLDLETAVDAVENTDPELCETIENDVQKAECLETVDDQIALDIAVFDADLNKCGEIKNESTQEKCKILVQSEIDKNEEIEKVIKENEELDKQRDIDEANLDEVLKEGPLTKDACNVIEDPEFKESCIEAAEIVEQQTE